MMKRAPRRKRRKNTSTRAVQALAAGAAIATGTQAYAEPIRFENPVGAGHFDWAAGVFADAKWLDVTLDADSQPAGIGPGADTPASFWHHPASYGGVFNGGGGAPNVLRDGYALVGLGAGELVAPTGGQYWDRYGFVEYAGSGPLIPEGQPSYLGVRFDVGAGDQYGWIGVVRDGLELDAFAWGYETEPGEPIAAGIPEPGTLAALAFGAAFVSLARRRS
jgi:hypothetical protein